MTSQITQCIEYLILTDNILLHSNLIKNIALLTGFQKDLIIIQKWLIFYWPPCIAGDAERQCAICSYGIGDNYMPPSPPPKCQKQTIFCSIDQ